MMASMRMTVCVGIRRMSDHVLADFIWLGFIIAYGLSPDEHLLQVRTSWCYVKGLWNSPEMNDTVNTA